MAKCTKEPEAALIARGERGAFCRLSWRKEEPALQPAQGERLLRTSAGIFVEILGSIYKPASVNQRHEEAAAHIVARMPIPLIAEVEAWATANDTTRSDAIGRLVELGLQVKAPR